MQVTRVLSLNKALVSTWSVHMRHPIANDINIHKVSNRSRHLIAHRYMSHMTWDQVLDIAHDIPVLGHLRPYPTKDICKTMSCPVRDVSTTTSFPVNGILRMSSLTHYVSDFYLPIIIVLDTLTRVESKLLLHCAWKSHVDSGLGITAIS